MMRPSLGGWLRNVDNRPHASLQHRTSTLKDGIKVSSALGGPIDCDYGTASLQASDRSGQSALGCAHTFICVSQEPYLRRGVIWNPYLLKGVDFRSS